jgi:Flp pilus assembly protein TadD
MGTALGSEFVETKSLGGRKNAVARLTADQGLSAFHVRIASALLEQELAEPALAIARIALWYNPASDPAKIVTAKALASLGDIVQPLALLDSVTATSPYWPRMVAAKVDVIQATGDANRAASFARESSLLKPASLPLAILLGQTLQQSGAAGQAATQYRAIIERAGAGGQSPRQRAAYRLLLASSLDGAGDWVGAKHELEAALVLDPNNAQALNFLGYAMLGRNEDLTRAASLIQRAYQIAPDSAAIADSMGWVHYRKGEIGTAVTLLEKAAKSANNDAAINEHLGDAYWQLGRRREARYAWRMAAQVADPVDAERIATKIDLGLPEAKSPR